MLLISLNGKDSIFEQIKMQIVKFIEIGALKPGEKLPSVRMLAQDLGINPNTVARAYSELEAEGVIYTMNKKGAYVSDKKMTDNIVLISARKAIASLKAEGLKYQDLLKIAEETYGGNNARSS